MAEYPGLLARWLQLLAVKGVQELVFVNRPWPPDMPLPRAFFGMANLTRLYLGFFQFPDTTAVPRAAAFPYLRELGLCCVPMLRREDMDFILARSPVLEILCIHLNTLIKHLDIVSSSLRCVQIIEAVELNITVKNAPHLERLIIWSSSVRDDLPRLVKIGRAPALSLIGYLDPEVHILEVGNTVIKVHTTMSIFSVPHYMFICICVNLSHKILCRKFHTICLCICVNLSHKFLRILQAGTRASRSTVVPSVKILGLRVYFAIRNNAKMLPSFLRCFPNVETIHLEVTPHSLNLASISNFGC